MKAIRVLYAFMAIVLAASLLPAAPVQARTSAQAPAADAEYVPGQIMVTFKTGQTDQGYAAQAAALASLVQGEVLKRANERVLLSVSENADIKSIAALISVGPGIQFAEPNYVYKLTPISTSVTAAAQKVTETIKVGAKTAQVPVETLIKLRTTRAGKISATFPNDVGFVNSDALQVIGYSLIWNDTKVAKNICEIDTGVDSSHPDLYGKIINGPDLVNGDTSPMDDNGHGTFVAGLMVALPNNKIGTSGVSNGKVVAVKAVDAAGRATMYDLADAVRYCADRADVAVINMSVESPVGSSQLKAAIEYAISDHTVGTTPLLGKLIVAAAGNAGVYGASYPAAYHDQFYQEVIAVGAAGYQENPWDSPNQYCQAAYSNYGYGVNLVAPGTQLYSTMPYNKPFYLNTVNSVTGNYSTMSGTSMAAALVSAAAARVWAYQGAVRNWVIYEKLMESGQRLGDQYYWEWGCWNPYMENTVYLNVASALNRGGLGFNAVNAQTGAALDGATVYLYKGATLVGSSKLVSTTYSGYGSDSVKMYDAFTTFINLDASGVYTAKISKTGFTTTLTAASTNAVNAFVGWESPDGQAFVYPGYASLGGSAAIPPLSSSYTVVTAGNYSDPEQLVYTPTPNNFIVSTGAHGWDGYVPGVSTSDPYQGDATGSLRAWPYARQVFTVDSNNWYTKTNTTVIKNRAAASLPYYTGAYTLGAFDSANGNTSMFIWKNGKATRIDRTCDNSGGNVYWKAAMINSGSAAASVSIVNTCGTKDQMAYLQPNMLRVVTGAYSPEILDPQQSSFTDEIGHEQLIYEGLTRLNQNLEVAPGAASSWLYSNGGKTLSLTLRSGLTYSDGSPLNAERFRYAMLRTMDPQTWAEYGAILDEIVGASDFRLSDPYSPDHDTLRNNVQLYARHANGVTACTGYDDTACTRLIMNFNAPTYYFLQVLSLWVTYPVKQEIIETYGYRWWEDAANHIGNGPFKLVRYAEGQEAIFVPNSAYWGAHPTYNIKYLYMNSEDASNAYWQGDIDIFVPTVAQAGEFSDQLLTGSGTCVYGMLFNFSKPPFDDPNVRKAFAMSINRDNWISEVLGGGGVKSLSWIPAGIPGHDPTENRWDYNVAAAQAAWEASPYVTSGVYSGPEIKFTFADTTRNVTRWVWLKNQINSVLGTDITIDPVNPAEWSERIKSVDTQPQTYILGWCGDYPDPQNYMSVYWKTGGFSTRINYSNPVLDSKLNEADAAPESTRIGLYQQAEDILIGDVPFAGMWNNQLAFVVNPRVSGISMTPFDALWPGIYNLASITVNP